MPSHALVGSVALNDHIVSRTMARLATWLDAPVWRKHLAALVNQLNRAVHDRTDKATLEALFEKLTDYTAFHFQTEQDLMERFNYPRKQAHNLEHAGLLADASHFKARLHRGGDLLVLQSIKDWLLQHITTEDKPLGEFLKGKLDT